MSTSETASYRQTFSEMARLAVPIVLVQVGMMLMGVVDTMVVGRVSALALAAVAVGNLYSFGVLAFGMGALMALDPIIAQAVGARDDRAISRGMQRGILLALGLTVPTSLLLLPVAPILRLARQPEELIPLASQFAHISIVGVLGFYLFVVFRQTLQAMGRLAAVVWTIVLANVLNLGVNWILVFGHLGFPPMGAAGAAWATAISRWVMAAAILFFARADLRPRLSPWSDESLDHRSLWGMFRVGAPIGFQYMLEFGVFGVVGLMMGALGTSEVAGHQVALNLASLTFNVPLGVASAAAVMVGRAVGAEDAIGARHSATAALSLAAGFMSSTALLFLTSAWPLARLYTHVDEVLAVATTLIPLAGVFQVFDGIQVTAIGILRGLGDTRAPMLVNILGFWLIGFPTSLLLGFRAGMGPAGLWWGLVAGLAAVAIVLAIRVRVKLGRGARRLQYEAPGRR